MTDRPIIRSYNRSRTRTTGTRSSAAPQSQDAARPNEVRRSFIATLDKPLIFIVGLLLVIGGMMVLSTTFDWSYYEYGNPTSIFLQSHMRNLLLALGAMTFFAVIDYRFWRRFAVIVLLGTIAALIAVLLFGDDTFGARRALINGSLQPGELAEFTIVFYMAAWLGSRNTKIQSFLYGLIPFAMLVAIVGGLVAIQPDLSSTAIIFGAAVVMFFLAGADIVQLIGTLGIGSVVGVFIVQYLPYAQTRVADYLASFADLRNASYHTQQAIQAFINGGWLGVGLGQGQQKFRGLPAAHTDSIFAVIGEELGVIGAVLVILLFIFFAVRGFQIANRAVDPFGALLCVGFTVWVVLQALLNIAVMIALVPSTGVPLPFISYGGSNLLVLMIGIGLMLSVHRVSLLRQQTERRNTGANYDRGWGNRRARLSRADRRRSTAQTRS